MNGEIAVMDTEIDMVNAETGARERSLRITFERVTKGVAPGHDGFRPRRSEVVQERLPMRKIREMLRLRWCLGYGVRQTAASVGVVSYTTARAKACELDWQGAAELSMVELEQRLYGAKKPQLPKHLRFLTVWRPYLYDFGTALAEMAAA